MAIIFMLLSVGLFGAYPFIASVSGQTMTPSFIIWVTHLMASFGIAAFLLIRFGWHRLRTALEIQDRTLFRRSILYFTIDGAANAFSNIFLIIAIVSYNKYAVSLIFDGWPILSMVIIPLFLAKTYKLRAKDYLFSIISFAGLAIVVSTSTQDALVVQTIDISGLLLAFGAMALMAISSMVNLKAEETFEKSVNIAALAPKRLSLDLVSSTMANAISRFFSGTVSLFYFIFARDTPSLSGPLDAGDMMLLAVFSLIITFGGIFYVVANMRATSSGINLLWNLTPMVAVLLLFASGLAGVPGPEVFLGAILIVAANLAVSMQLALTRSFYVFLFTFCAVVAYDYYVPGLASPDYYAAVGIPVGLFAIIAGFLIARLQDRKTTHLHIATTIVNSLQTLPPKPRKELSTVLAMGLRNRLDEDFDTRVIETAGLLRQDHPQLAEQVTTFGIVRLRHINYSEGTVIWVLSLLIAFIAMVFRDGTPIMQITAVFLSSIVVFLASYATDFSVTVLDKVLILGNAPHAEGAPTHKDLKDFQLRSVVGIGFTALLLTLYLASVFTG